MQYPEMNALQSAYADDFRILAFPCNQYWIQEPGSSAEEIINGIKHVRPGGGFTPNFQLFKKIEVAGENQHPLYNYLTRNCPPTRNYFSSAERLVYKPIMQQDIRWNWEKFLVGVDGRVVKRYDGGTKPAEIEPDVREVLGLTPLPPQPADTQPQPKLLQPKPHKIRKSRKMKHGKYSDSYEKNKYNEKFYPSSKGKLSQAKKE